MNHQKYIFIFDEERIFVDNYNMLNCFSKSFSNIEIHVHKKSRLVEMYNLDLNGKYNFHYFKTRLFHRFAAKLYYIFILENTNISLKKRTISYETRTLRYFYDIFFRCPTSLKFVKVLRKFKLTNYLLRQFLKLALKNSHPLKSLDLRDSKVCLFTNTSQSQSFVFFENIVVKQLKKNAFLVVEGWDNLCSKLFLRAEPCTALVQSQQTRDHLYRFSKVSPDIHIIGQSRINSYQRKKLNTYDVSYLPSNADYESNLDYLTVVLDILLKTTSLNNEWSNNKIHCRLHPFVEIQCYAIKETYPEIFFSSKREADGLVVDAMEILEMSKINIVGPSTVFLESVLLRKPTILLVPEASFISGQFQYHEAMMELINFLKNNSCLYVSSLSNLDDVLNGVLKGYSKIIDDMENLDLSYFVEDVKYIDTLINSIS